MVRNHWYDSAYYIGDPSKEYTIYIVDHRQCGLENWQVYGWSSGLHAAIVDVVNCKIIVDHDRIVKHVPSPVMICNKNHAVPNFFMINDHLFMFVNADCPEIFQDQWIPHYGSVCSAFFVLQLRESYLDLFKQYDTPAFPLPMKFHPTVPRAYMEMKSRQNPKKDIPVFFSGRTNTRPRRSVGIEKIKRHFPGSFLHVSNNRIISYQEYCDLLCRAKIVWCPRSVCCPGHEEENGITSKENEAMCVESMVLRHALHVKEQEPRIPGIHFVEMEVKESDMLEKVQYYLDHDDEREEIAYNGRLWYERNWAPTPQAHFIVNRCLEAMGEPHEPWLHDFWPEK